MNAKPALKRYRVRSEASGTGAGEIVGRGEVMIGLLCPAYRLEGRFVKRLSVEPPPTLAGVTLVLLLCHDLEFGPG